MSRYKPNFILVTHSHGDHLGDAIEIAKAAKAQLVTVNFPSLFQKEKLPDELIQTINVGGTITLADVKVHVVPAMHGSEPSGRPVGFVVEFSDGRSVYHQDDTWIFGDMALIQEFYRPNDYSDERRRQGVRPEPGDRNACDQQILQATDHNPDALRVVSYALD